jgi:hypothetical protein
VSEGVGLEEGAAEKEQKSRPRGVKGGKRAKRSV